MSRSGGRKIYRKSSYAKKMRLKKAGGIFAACLGIAVLVFVGYSVAKPIFNFLNSEDNISEIQSEPWTPPVVTDAVQDDAEADSEKNDSNTAENDKIDAAFEAEINSVGYTAYMLPENALTSPTMLNSYLEQAKTDGYNSVIVTLKAEGGKIYYNTRSEFAAMDENAVVGVMPVQQITAMIKNSGIKAIASINLLEDNNRYGENRDGSYHNTDGTTWLDNAVAKGGKPWLSPFEEDTKEYIRFLAEEIAGAGFDAIAADGAVFPNFRNSDLNYIGDSVKSGMRYMALLDVVNIVRSAAEAQSVGFMLEVNAADILYGRAEVYKPEQLGKATLFVEFSPSDFNESFVYNNQEIVVSELSAQEKFKTVFGIISAKSGENITIIPVISRNDMNQVEYSDTIQELISENYDSYAVK